MARLLLSIDLVWFLRHFSVPSIFFLFWLSCLGDVKPVWSWNKVFIISNIDERVAHLELLSEKYLARGLAGKSGELQEIKKKYHAIKLEIEAGRFENHIMIDEQIGPLDNALSLLWLKDRVPARFEVVVRRLEEATTEKRDLFSKDEQNLLEAMLEKIMKFKLESPEPSRDEEIQKLLIFIRDHTLELEELQKRLEGQVVRSLHRIMASDISDLMTVASVYETLLKSGVDRAQPGETNSTEGKAVGKKRILLLYIHWADADSLTLSDRVTVERLLGEIRDWYAKVSYGRFDVLIDVCEATSPDMTPLTNVEIAYRGVKLCDDQIDFWNAHYDYLAIYPGRAQADGPVWVRAEGADFPFELFGLGFDTLSKSTFEHELGHILGLRHSHKMVCPGYTYGHGCRHIEYGNNYSTMGTGNGHYSCGEKELLGWLKSQQYSPKTGKVYQMTALELLSQDLQCLVVPKTITTRGYFQNVEMRWGGLVSEPCDNLFVEYRKPILGDEGMSWINAVLGDDQGQVIVSCGGRDEDGLTNFWLIDFHPHFIPALSLEGLFPHERKKMALGYTFSVKPLDDGKTSVEIIRASVAEGAVRNSGGPFSLGEEMLMCPVASPRMTAQIPALNEGKSYDGWIVSTNMLPRVELDPDCLLKVGLEGSQVRLRRKRGRMSLHCRYTAILNCPGYRPIFDLPFHLRKEAPQDVFYCDDDLKPGQFNCYSLEPGM